GDSFVLARYSGDPFDFCIVDDSDSGLIQINSGSGAYLFTRCSDLFMLAGTGNLGTEGGIITLRDSGPDRKLTASFNRNARTGTATLRFHPSQGPKQVIQLNDTNPGAACSCRR